MDDFYKKLERVGDIRPIFGPPGGHDPLRMVLLLDHPLICARRVHEWLSDQGIDIEFSDLKRLVLLVSPGQPQEDFERLFSALSEVMKNKGLSCSADETDTPTDDLEILWKRSLHLPPVRTVSVRDAFFSGIRKSVSYEDAAGAVSAGPISPYPPGIPLIWPGEKITHEHILLLTGLKQKGITISGMHDGHILIRN